MIFKRRKSIFILPIAMQAVTVVLPFLGIAISRLYETELIRQTESNLLAQAVAIRTRFLQELESSPELHPSSKKLTKKLAKRHNPRKRVVYEWLPTLDVNNTEKLPPIFEEMADSVKGDVAAKKIAARLNKFMDSLQFNLLASIRIFDSNGVVVGTTGKRLDFTLLDREEVKLALKGKIGRSIRQKASYRFPLYSKISFASGGIVYIAVPIIHNDAVVGGVLLGRTPKSLARSLYLHRNTFLALLAVLFAVNCIATIWVTSYIIRPIRSIVHELRSLKNDQNQAFECSAADKLKETQVLSDAIAGLWKSSQEQLQYLQTMVRLLIHEVKTPVSSIVATSEVLNQFSSEMNQKERSDFYHQLAKDGNKLANILDRVYALTKAEHEAMQSRTIKVKRLYDFLGLEYPELNILDEAYTHLALKIPEETILLIFENLVKNAQMHGKPPFVLKCDLQLNREQQRKVLCFYLIDSGAAIDQSELNNALKPFYTTTRPEGGMGLGLTLIQNLIKRSGGNFKAIDRDDPIRAQMQSELWSLKKLHTDLKGFGVHFEIQVDSDH